MFSMAEMMNGPFNTNDRVKKLFLFRHCEFPSDS